MAKSVPPTLRMSWLAFAIMPSNSSGACSSSTPVSAFAMLVATGSASCVQIGIVVVTHSVRLMRRGATVNSEMSVDSASQSEAT